MAKKGQPMYIRIKLPAQYYKLQELKKDNFPYRSIFSEFMKAVIKLGMREQLSTFAVFGRVEHALAADKPLDLTKTGELVSLDYREDDDDIVDFYKASSLTQKQQTLMFVRLLLRLQGVVGNSVPEMIYLIDNISASDEVEIEDNPEVKPTAVSVVPGIRIHKKAVSESKAEQPQTKPKKQVAKHGDAKPSSTPPKESKKDDQATEKEKSSLERIVEHAEKLTSMADEASGEVVKTNPLMSEFYDFN